MTNVNLGSLNEWETLAIGETVAFDIPKDSHEFRAVDFDLISDGPISVQAESPDGKQLLAYSPGGQFNVRFTCGHSTVVICHGEADVNIALRTKMRSQVVAESDEPTFTTIEPRSTPESDALKRMQHMMQINERARMKTMQEEIARIRASVSAPEADELIEATPTPAKGKKGTPAPAQAVSDDTETE